MQIKDDKIKDIFSSRLSKFEPTVPDDIWNKIAENLPQEKKIHPRTKRMILYKQLAVAASVAAVIALSLLFIDNEDQTTAKQINSNFGIERLNPNYQPKRTTAEVFPNTALPKSNQSPILAMANNTPKEETIYKKQQENSENINPEQNTKDENGEQDTYQNQTIHKNDPDLKKKIEEFANQGNKPIFETSEEITKTTKKRNNISLSFGGQTGFYNNGESRAKVQSSLRTFTQNTQDVLSGAEEKEIISGYEKYFNDIPVKVDHNQPISFGLMVSKNLNSRLSIETGLVYTYLSSKIQTEKKSIVKRIDRQYFHYLGMPISLNYTFASWGKAEFYASAGGMIQKDIQGRYNEEQNLDSDSEQSSVINKENIHQSKPQFSVLGKVGASYPIYDKLHLYTTVGGAYYIDANNKYRTIYSDKKLQLDLNIGLKLKF